MLEVAIKAAREAGKIAKEHYGKRKSISYKENEDICTNVDTLIEETIKSFIKKYFPDHSFWGEESGKDDVESPHCWLVDPIEGTTNYARKSGYYAISIALMYHEEPIIGVVFNPITQELFTAEKGKGAFLNGGEITVSAEDKLEKSTLFFSRFSKSAAMMRKVIGKIKTVRITGSSAYDICLVAAGRTEAFISCDGSPEGLAASSRIVREAGGIVSYIGKKNANHKNNTILLSNRALSKKIKNILV